MPDRKILSGIIILAVALFSSDLFACEACQKILSFTETARQSDLIVIAGKINDSEKSGNPQTNGKPDWIEVRVSRVLKGNLAKDVIRVNSWDGMCQYGVALEDGGVYVIFLVKRGNAPCDHCEYDAVNYGCAVRSYRIQNDKVYMDKDWIPLNDFIKSLPL